MYWKGSFKSLFTFFSQFIFNNPMQNSRWFVRKEAARNPFLDSQIPLEEITRKTILCDIHGGLLRSSSLFPYFMLMAFEGGGPLRALILLVSYPFISLLNEETQIKVMVFICFCGIREKDGIRVQRTVMPKFFMDDVASESFEILSKAKKTICFTVLPKIMVEVFLREHLKVNTIIGKELQVTNGYFTGNIASRENLSNEPVEDTVGFSSYDRSSDLSFYKCKEVYLVSEEEKRNWVPLPRSKYPQPLMFHDARLAFRPNPTAMLAMFIWIPIGLLLALVRFLIMLFIPPYLTIYLYSLTGMKFEFRNPYFCTPTAANMESKHPKRSAFVCNHRNNFDAVFVSACLNKRLTAVTYGISKLNELFSPLRTVRLSRTKNQDRSIMDKILGQGDLLVFPEGTTNREPFLLRFSPLFAELCDEVVPVAINSQVSMFHGTTANGYKLLDPVLFLMNPFTFYEIEILQKISTVDHGSKFDVTNLAQKQIASALGFLCTKLTRRDKYLILSGHEGIVPNWFHPNKTEISE